MCRSKGRVLAGAVTGLVTLLAAVGIALAAKPTAGDTYSAEASSTEPFVNFKAVSAKKLTDLTAGPALKCGKGYEGGLPTGFFKRSSTKVSNRGTFKAGGKLPDTGTKVGTETITGKFVSSTKVIGTVTTVYNEQSKGKSGTCWGVTQHYMAVGKPPTT